jgi:hypothetical protein
MVLAARSFVRRSVDLGARAQVCRLQHQSRNRADRVARHDDDAGYLEHHPKKQGDLYPWRRTDVRPVARAPRTIARAAEEERVVLRLS